MSYCSTCSLNAQNLINYVYLLQETSKKNLILNCSGGSFYFFNVNEK